MEMSSGSQQFYVNMESASEDDSGEMLLDFVECMDDISMGEAANASDSNSFTSSIQQLKLYGVDNSPHNLKPLKDVTNCFHQDESPKSHLLPQTQLYDFNFNVTKRCNNEHQMTRKKSSDSTPVMLKKRRSFKNTTNKSNIKGKEKQTTLYAYLPVLSSTVTTLDSLRPSVQPVLPEFLDVVYSLETVSKPQVESTAFKSVSGKVIAKLMNSMSEEEFSSKYVLVDCRYPYEYSGGHLRGAINIFDTAQVAEVFFPPCEELFRKISLKIPIFYCEYSQKRGPTMANKLRQLDRQRNVENYPEVDYKEIYLLDRGYKKFFEVDNLVHLCEPQSYISMSATPHKEDLKHYHFHKSRSSDSFDSVTLEVQRKVRERVSHSTDEEMVAGRGDPTTMPCSSLPLSNRTSCRGNIFGSQLSKQESQSPELTDLQPMDF